MIGQATGALLAGTTLEAIKLQLLRAGGPTFNPSCQMWYFQQVLRFAFSGGELIDPKDRVELVHSLYNDWKS